MNECDPNPCSNGGNCTDQLNAYLCSCETGYTGTDCEMEVDECDSDPCLNGGLCIDELGTFFCECLGGWTGSTCESCQMANCDTAQCQGAAVKCVLCDGGKHSLQNGSCGKELAHHC